MLRAACANPVIAAECLLALAGIDHPTPEQTVGARLKARLYFDVNVLARGKIWKED